MYIVDVYKKAWHDLRSHLPGDGLKEVGVVIAVNLFAPLLLAFGHHFGRNHLNFAPPRLNNPDGPLELDEIADGAPWFFTLGPRALVYGWYLGHALFILLSFWLDDQLPDIPPWEYRPRQGISSWRVRAFKDYKPGAKFCYLLGFLPALAIQSALFALTIPVTLLMAALFTTYAVSRVALTLALATLVGVIGTVFKDGARLVNYLVSLNSDDVRSEEQKIADAVINVLPNANRHLAARAPRWQPQPRQLELPHPAIPDLVEQLDAIIVTHAPQKTSEEIQQLDMPEITGFIDSATQVDMVNPHMLKCGHSFSLQSIREWEQKNQNDCKCMTCRASYQPSDVKPNLRLAEAIDEFGLWKKQHGLTRQAVAEEKSHEEKSQRSRSFSASNGGR